MVVESVGYAKGTDPGQCGDVPAGWRVDWIALEMARAVDCSGIECGNLDSAVNHSTGPVRV